MRGQQWLCVLSGAISRRWDVADDPLASNQGSTKRHTLNFRVAKSPQSDDFGWICKHLAPLQIQALLLGPVDIKPGGLH